MQHLTGAGLRHKFREELHCNEVSLLPYYVASMNIEGFDLARDLAAA